MERKTIEENKESKRDYAVLVGLRSPVLGADSADEESLAELGALVETAGGEPVGTILQSREKPDPHSFIGEGKVEEVRRMVDNSDATARAEAYRGQLQAYSDALSRIMEKPVTRRVLYFFACGAEISL